MTVFYDPDAMTPAQRDKFYSSPAGAPPKGVLPNYDNPDDMVTEFLVLCTICSVLTGLLVSMRFYTRWKLTRRFLFEDLILLIGWLLFVAGFNTPVFISFKYHLGAHRWDFRLGDMVVYLKLFHYGTLFFDVTMLFLRLAIIMQVLRHFVPAGARNFTFWSAYFLIATNAAFWISITFIEIYQCKPRRKIWEPYLKGTCLDKHWYMAATGVMNLVSEIAIIFLPQRIIWGLTLSTKRKLELTPLFMMGTFTCICSAIRLWQIIVRWDYKGDHGDVTYYMADAVMIWTVPEIASCVLVPCLPSLPQFIRIIRNRPLTIRGTPSMLQVDRSSWSEPRRKHVNPSEVITDREYHELVMRTETTVASAEREDTGPWIQTPATVLIRGGKGPTKTFIAPSYYPQ